MASSIFQVLTERSTSIGIATVLVLNLLLRFWIVFRPLECTDGISIPDDTYISLTLARNIAHGSGATFAGEPTNGFQPLFVLLMVPVFLAASHDVVLPVHVATGLSAIFDTITLLLLCLIVARRCTSSLVIFPVALAWIFNPGGIRTATNGMETSLAGCFLMCGLFLTDREITNLEARATWRASLSIGLLVGLGMIARIDNVFLGASALVVLIALGRNDLPRACGNALILVMGAFIAYIPWLAFSYFTTRDLFPISGKAVRLMSLATVDFKPTWGNWYSLVLRAGLDAVVQVNKTVLIAGAVTLVSLLLVRGQPSGRIQARSAWVWPAAIFAILLFAAYTLYVFGPWFYMRYLFSSAIAFLLLLALLVDLLLQKMPHESHRRIAAMGITVLIAALNLVDPEFRQTYFSGEKPASGYMNVGLWAKRTFVPGTVIGCAQSGAIGYFADSLQIINLDGVVSKSCYESLLHFKTMAYLRERRVQFVVGWYSNFQYLEHQSETGRLEGLGPPTKIEGIQSWGYDWYVAKVLY